MKIKLGIIYNSIEALKVLRSCKMDVLKAYQLRKLLAEIQVEIDSIETIRKDLIKKHGVEIEKDGKKTGEYQINFEKQEAFMSDLNTLFDKEIELKELKNAKLGIRDLEGNKIETVTLSQLDWLID